MIQGLGGKNSSGQSLNALNPWAVSAGPFRSGAETQSQFCYYRHSGMRPTLITPMALGRILPK